MLPSKSRFGFDYVNELDELRLNQDDKTFPLIMVVLIGLKILVHTPQTEELKTIAKLILLYSLFQNDSYSRFNVIDTTAVFVLLVLANICRKEYQTYIERVRELIEVHFFSNLTWETLSEQ